MRRTSRRTRTASRRSGSSSRTPLVPRRDRRRESPQRSGEDAPVARGERSEPSGVDAAEPLRGFLDNLLAVPGDPDLASAQVANVDLSLDVACSVEHEELLGYS